MLVTGTHFSQPNTDAAQRKAMRIAAPHGRKVVFDIDYRPNLWGLAGHGAGEERYIKSDEVSAHLQTDPAPTATSSSAPRRRCCIAGGADDPLAALRADPRADRRRPSC